MAIHSKNATAGVLFILLGVGFGLNAYLTLDLGTSSRMGPGYFPLLLSAILTLLGGVILIYAIRVSGAVWGTVPWRGLAFILIGVITFGATMQYLGLVPSLAVLIFLTSFASRRMTLWLAAALTASLTLFCVAVFHWGLGMPVALFAPWMRAIGLGN